MPVLRVIELDVGGAKDVGDYATSDPEGPEERSERWMLCQDLKPGAEDREISPGLSGHDKTHLKDLPI